MYENFFLKSEISKLYKQILLRAPDRDGLHYWISQIISGNETLDTLQTKLRDSPEALLVNDFVKGFTVTKDGVGLYLNNKDNFLSRDIAFQKIWEPQITNLIKELVSSGQVVVDVGAHIGYFTTLFSKLVGKNGKVYSFEPSLTNFEILKKNLMNCFDNVILFQKAVSDTSGKNDLYLSTWNTGDNRLFKEERDKRDVDREKIQVETIMLDNLIEEKVDLIKIDVQGLEKQVIDGAKKLIHNNDDLKIIFEFTPQLLKLNHVDPQEFLCYLLDKDFDLYDVDAGNNLINYNIEEICERYSSCSSLNLFCERS